MTCVKVGLLIGLLCTLMTFGQTTKDNSNSSIKVDIDLVLVNATVTDSSHRYVGGLSPEHFQVFEDKVKQDVQYFSQEDVPLSVGVIFDSSGSMESKMMPARAAAATFLRMGNRGDEYFLVEFNDSPTLLQDFTSDITRLQNRLLATRARGSTSLYDALYLGMERVNRGNNPRKALLLITDGEDNHSRYSFGDVREYAKEHDVAIYGIGIIDEATAQYSDHSGKGVLEELAKLTGGIAFFPDSLGALENICAQIGMDLKNQYVLGYHSANHTTDGKWRKIQVKMSPPKGSPRLSVRTKTGYYAPRIATAMK
jgi:Ca-activated chloride channel family protein